MEKIMNEVHKLAYNIASDKTTLNEVIVRMDAYIDWIRLEEYTDEESLNRFRDSAIHTIKSISDTYATIGNSFLKKDIAMMGDVLKAFAN